MASETTFNEILRSYKIKARCVSSNDTNSYMSFDVALEAGGKVRDLTKYADEISLRLKSYTKPTVKVLHNEGVVRVGFAKKRIGRLELFNLLTKKNDGLNCILGETIDGSIMKMDLSLNPHMIISGTTGSGKSVLLHNIIANLLNNNSSKIVLLDPKNIEFDIYTNVPNIYVKHSYLDCLTMISYLSKLMDHRYSLIARNVDVSRMPYITIIIDEFADLIMQDEDKQFYYHLCRLAQKCRAAKMHIILATQRPAVDVINGTIKANFPARIACRTSSVTDSRVILDCKGAENLLGKGDALLKDNTRNLERFQAAFTTPEEVYGRFNKNTKKYQ